MKSQSSAGLNQSVEWHNVGKIIKVQVQKYLLGGLFAPTVIYTGSYYEETIMSHVKNTYYMYIDFWQKIEAYPGFILGLHPANERRYKVTASLIGWVQT